MGRNRTNSSNQTRKYKKKFLWTERNEKILLKFWKERIHELRSSRKNKPVYEEMRQKLKQKGCVVEINEIKHKMHNLTSKYRKEKLNRANGCTPSEWPIYDTMDDMLACFEMVKVVDLVGEISRCLGNKSPPDENNFEKSEDNHYEYVNDNFFAYENENEDDAEEEETASTSMPEYKDAKSNTNTVYLKAINTNLKLMVEKVNELSENIQSWEEKGNSQLEQMSNILSKHIAKASMPAKRKLSQNDDAMQDIANFDEEMPNNHIDEDETKVPTLKKSYTLVRNKIILDDYLKTKQLEREYMAEKHNLQIEILKLELEALRKKST